MHPTPNSRLGAGPVSDRLHVGNGDAAPGPPVPVPGSREEPLGGVPRSPTAPHLSEPFHTHSNLSKMQSFSYSEHSLLRR